MRRLYQNVSFIFLSASLAAKVSGLSAKVSNNNNNSHHLTSRRNWIGKLVTAASATYTTNPPSPAVAQQVVQELPIDLRRYTALAPLGDANTSTGNKLTGLSMDSIASRLSHDLVDGSTGKGGYFISGDISTEIFRDNCEFTDPTNSVSSLAKYQKALTILFNPEQSFVELVPPLEIDVPKREITGRIRSGGVLKLPWNPRISSYESTIKWKIDYDGLIESQIQQWSIPASQALRETFTPSF
mmetsp:Transcript_16256/g.32854  ORF Transcript_16256/g.32854 Transcript_16256/m.32854 type:complete len:242 (+) Transcript_16256:182-907(+)